MDEATNQVLADMKASLDEKPDVEFDDDKLEAMLEWLHPIIEGLVPGESFTLNGDQNIKRINIEVEFENPDVVGLFMGPGRRIVYSLLTMVRFQQFLPHNRYIKLVVIKPDGDHDVIWNRKVFNRG